MMVSGPGESRWRNQGDDKVPNTEDMRPMRTYSVRSEKKAISNDTDVL